MDPMNSGMRYTPKATVGFIFDIQLIPNVNVTAKSLA